MFWELKILPYDEDAARLADVSLHFGDFFEKYSIEVPRLTGRALLWGHCHQRATGGMEGEQKTLERMGLDVESLKGGCCGLAGSWGFEQGKYEISMDCGEEALLPAVRAADPATVVVADGFSCKTQVEQAGVGGPARHLGQVMRLAVSEETSKPVPSAGRRVARTVGPPVAAAGLAGAALAFRRFGG